MENETPTITINASSVINGNYAVFTVRSFGANVKRKTNNGERTVWATLDVPQDKVLQYAYPLIPGAGPQPENTITCTELHDMVKNVLFSLEWSLDEADNKTTGDNW